MVSTYPNSRIRSKRGRRTRENFSRPPSVSLIFLVHSCDFAYRRLRASWKGESHGSSLITPVPSVGVEEEASRVAGAILDIREGKTCVSCRPGSENSQLTLRINEEFARRSVPFQVLRSRQATVRRKEKGLHIYGG